MLSDCTQCDLRTVDFRFKSRNVSVTPYCLPPPRTKLQFFNSTRACNKRPYPRASRIRRYYDFTIQYIVLRFSDMFVLDYLLSDHRSCSNTTTMCVIEVPTCLKSTCTRDNPYTIIDYRRGRFISRTDTSITSVKFKIPKQKNSKVRFTLLLLLLLLPRFIVVARSYGLSTPVDDK